MKQHTYGLNGLRLPLHTYLYAYAIQMDTAINFGFVPAVESQSQQFLVVNSGDTLVRNLWKA